jgi:phosphoglycerol transferase MdoB-like AlkP superfamily enzyme
LNSLRSIKPYFFNLLRFAGFWLLFFQLLRLIFVGYHWDKFAEGGVTMAAKSLWYGVRFDLALACYFCIIPVLIWMIQIFIRFKAGSKVINIYAITLIVITSIAAVADVQVFQEWGSKLNAEVLFYLNFPAEAMASISSAPLLTLGALMLLAASGGVTIYKSFFRQNPPEAVQLQLRTIAAKGGYFALIALGILIGARGGVQLAAFNPSFAYFSKSEIANNAALNPCFNLMYSLTSSDTEQLQALHYLADAEAESRTRNSMVHSAGERTYLFNIPKPNIVLVMLEGWTADVVATLDGEPDVTPYFDSLCQSGFLFTNFYASGDRTYKAVPAILSGFPALPDRSIIKNTDKIQGLPSLPEALINEGYRTGFYYGGESQFANIKAYLRSCAFDTIHDMYSWDRSFWDSKWGVHDGLLFDLVLKDLDDQQQPFFASILTSSSHEPYTVPMETRFEGTDEPAMFMNSVHYTDKCVAQFMESAKQEVWYENTVFIFVADHGKRYPRLRKAWQKEMFRIPMLVVGAPLKSQYAGATWDEVASQTDIPNIILGQLDADDREFEWGKDVLHSGAPKFAFYDFNNGFGFITPENEVVWNNRSGQTLVLEGDPLLLEEHLKNGQSMMQMLAKAYLD